VYQAFLVDEDVRAFLKEANPHALRDVAEKLEEAVARGFWTPRSNSARFDLSELAA
ncbi:MAG: cobaltochelatase subunit CobN, partial [Alphaproteobacteria bacterium]